MAERKFRSTTELELWLNFATAALNGFVTGDPLIEENAEGVSEMAFDVADAMLEEAQKRMADPIECQAPSLDTIKEWLHFGGTN